MSDMLTGLASTVSGGGGGGASWISKLIPLLMGGSTVAGTIGNIGANKARNSVLSSEMAQMKSLQGLTPDQIVKGIAALQQPLSKSLVSGVGNTVQGQLGERGLSQAPGIYAQSLAQGLAPYQLQEQQLAQQAYFQKLGLPISARPSPFGPFPQQTNTSQLWQSLAQRFMKPGGNGAPADPFNYWAANNANPKIPSMTLPDLYTPAPDLGNPDWLASLSSTPGIVPGTGG